MVTPSMDPILSSFERSHQCKDVTDQLWRFATLRVLRENNKNNLIRTNEKYHQLIQSSTYCFKCVSSQNVFENNTLEKSGTATFAFLSFSNISENFDSGNQLDQTRNPSTMYVNIVNDIYYSRLSGLFEKILVLFLTLA